MKIKSIIKHQTAKPRGLALVMTVIILALVTVMVLGFADLVRNETIASSSHVDRARAQALSELGVDMVIGTLRTYTADPDSTWASQPGSLLVPAEGATGAGKNQLGREIPLHSGLPSTSTPTEDDDDQDENDINIFAPANLNVQMINDEGTHLVTDLRGVSVDGDQLDVVALPLRWVYVRKNGDFAIEEEPILGNVENPVVGRFAWWVDDESSKININTAWKRNPATGGSSYVNPFGPSHVSSLHIPNLITSLDFASFGVSGNVAEAMKNNAVAMADTMHLSVTPGLNNDFSPGEKFNYINVNRFFNSTYELRSLSNSIVGLTSEHFTALHNAAKFQITHYNHDPDTTFFNEPRIVLTTNKARARGLPFLDIAKDDNNTNLWNPISHIDAGKLAKTIDMLNEYLERTDWPVAPGSSFQEKYYAGKPERLTQLSLNIINYVRSKEAAGNPEGVVIPVRGEHKPGQAFQIMDVATSQDSYIGITRAPRITEMGLYVSNATGTLVPAVFKMEVYLPLNFGLESVDLSKMTAWYSVIGPTSNNGSIKGPVRADANSADGTASDNEKTILASEIIVNGRQTKILRKGQRASISRKTFVNVNGTRPTSVQLRFAISQTLRWDVTPLGDGSGKSAPAKLDDTTVPEGQITSIEVDDPRVNSHRNDWKIRTEGNSFGSANNGKTIKDGAEISISTLGETSTKVPQQDTDDTGKVTDYSLYMPPPAGSPGNESGMVESVGELGFIHTGMESGAGEGVPWRTLRLQPNDQPATMVPDWAFMDLFTVPVNLPEEASPRAKQMFGPHDGTAGRINLNAQAQPYGNSQYVATTLERNLPFIALLSDIPYSSADSPVNLDSTISTAVARDVARNIYKRTLATKGKQYGYATAFDSPGEVVEIKGVADWGEKSEEIVRGMSNLLCTRGGVFTVYSIGQTLQETRSGNSFTVTGEFRQQTMLERYTDAANPSEVKIRRLSFQPITP